VHTHTYCKDLMLSDCKYSKYRTVNNTLKRTEPHIPSRYT